MRLGYVIGSQLLTDTCMYAKDCRLISDSEANICKSHHCTD